MFNITMFLFVSHGILAPIANSDAVERKDVSGWVRGNKVSITVERIPFETSHGKQLWLRTGAAEKFNQLNFDAISNGFVINVNDAYRTMREQKILYNRNPDIAGKPGAGGERTHQTGAAIDIAGTNIFIHTDRVSKSDKFIKKMKDWVAGNGCREVKDGFLCFTRLHYWMLENGERYGFVNDIVDESWHYTYIGDME